MSEKDKYEIGYGKPPKSGQFAKGQSGNPKGRAKSTLNFKSDLRDVLKTQVPVNENGKQQKVTTQKATLMRLREQALKGNPRAMDRLLDLAKEYGVIEGLADQERQLSLTEVDILKNFEQSVLDGVADNRREEKGDE